MGPSTKLCAEPNCSAPSGPLLLGVEKRAWRTEGGASRAQIPDAPVHWNRRMAGRLPAPLSPVERAWECRAPPSPAVTRWGDLVGLQRQRGPDNVAASDLIPAASQTPPRRERKGRLWGAGLCRGLPQPT